MQRELHMSKTDKDLPYWVKAERHGVARHRHLSRRGLPLTCDLYAPTRGFDSCSWSLPLLRLSNCPTEYARTTFYAPDRSRVRDAVLALRREVNTYGDLVDGDVYSRQHRHSGLYDRE